MSYFKYAQRQIDSQINWAEIGKTMSETLKEEAAGRERLKSEIDEASRQYGETLSDAPTGDYDAGNTFALDYASSAQEYRLMQDRLLRSGQLNLRDYNIGRQNVMDGTENLFALSREYQEEYKTKMERWDGDESSFREVWEMEQAEGLGNLRASRGYINPTNGTVSVGKMVKDTETGIMKLSQDPNDFATVNDLRQRLKQKYDRFDVNEAASEAVDQLGVIETDVFNRASSRGKIHTIVTTVDAKQGDYTLEDEEFVATYKEWEDIQVSAMMVNANDVASVLTDYKLTAPNGERYTFTHDKDEFDAQGEDGNLIFLDQSENASGAPVFNEAQEQAVQETLKISIRAMIDEKVQVKTAGSDQQRTNRTSDAQRSKDDTQKGAMTNWDKLYWGNEAEKLAAANYISSINEDIEKIENIEGGIVIVYTDDSGRPTRQLFFGENQRQWAENINFGLPEKMIIENVNDVYKAAGIEGNREVSKAGFISAGVAKVTAEEAKGNFEDVYKDKAAADFNISAAADGIDMSLGYNKSEEKAIKQFKEQASNIYGIELVDYSVRPFKGSFAFGSGYTVTIDGQDYDVKIDGTKDDLMADLEPIKRVLINKGFSMQNMTLEEDEQDKFVDDYGGSGIDYSKK